MKTLLALASAALTLSFFGASEVQAGETHYRGATSSTHYQAARQPSRSAAFSHSLHNHSHNHVGFHNRAFRGCGPTPVQVYNYGYRSTWPMYYNRQLRDYNVYRSYPTSRGRFYGFWR